MTTTKLTTRDMCYIGILVALIAVMAQISIPMPLGVPMTMQTFAVYLCGLLLGSRRGALCALVYLLLGAVGAPVFSHFRGGVQMLAGPTGGFLLTFPLMAWLVGKGIELAHRRGSAFLGLLLGTAANYLGGMLLYSLLSSTTLWQAFVACVLPFLPTTILKAAAAAFLGIQLRRRGLSVR